VSISAPNGRPRLVVIGASAGGVPALTELVGALAPELAAAVLIVLHLPPNSRSMLPQILERAGHLPAAQPRDGEPLVTGQIAVAPPDHHLLVEGSRLRIVRGPWDNGHRPSVDALFRSAAYWYGERVVGVILTGALDDGAAGLAAVEAAGGTALVQDPRDAEVPDMPEHALVAVPGASRQTLRDLAKVLNDLGGVGKPVVLEPERRPDVSLSHQAEIAQERGERVTPEAVDMVPAGLSCPDCSGSLFVVPDENALRFRCRVGHGWTGAALFASHGRSLEHAIWAAIRVLEDNQALDDRIASRASRKKRSAVLRDLERRKEERGRLIAELKSAIAEFAETTGQVSELRDGST